MQKSGKHIIQFKFKSKFLLLILLSAILHSCSSTRHLDSNQKLLSKIKVEYKSESIYKDELLSISKQKPNRKLLGFYKLYLGIYNLYYNKPNSKIRNNVGEPPVIFDSSLVYNSTQLMTKYLQNRGYYNANVEASIKKKKKKAIISYNVDAKNQFILSRSSHKINDPTIKSLYNKNIENTTLKVGEPFDIELLNKERKRIEKILKNFGYYKFTKEYIQFEADTSNTNNDVRLITKINDKTLFNEYSDSSYSIPHKTYKINKVYVRINYTNQQNTEIKTDTNTVDSISFITVGESTIRRDVLTGLIYVKPGDMYRQDLQDITYRNLASLRIFSYVSITYDQDYESNDEGLVAFIDLNKRKSKSYTIESEGTNNGGNLGINANINFQHNNTFKGAEILNVKLAGGLEAQQLLTEDGDDQNISKILPFNTFEFGPEINLEVPRFLLPIKTTKVSQKGNPRTTFNTSLNFQDRSDYKRNLSKMYISYSWNETKTKKHIIQPIDFSYININLSSGFDSLLQDLDNSFLINSYTDNLIFASLYSFILNTQNSNKLKNHLYLRLNIESAGNLIGLITDTSNLKQNSSGAYLLGGVPYAQYLRSDFDFRYYQNFSYSKLVYRISSGLGIPYGNSSAMPFEKSFYSGGANGIRAWRARQLGPGNLNDSANTIDQIGNMRLEGNIEYRFGITNILEGAAFIDAGNIWNFNQEDSQEETQFKTNRIWRGTALGIGLGIRLNFTFFIFRLDFAAPIKDPAELNPEQIKPQWSNTNLNFGIGYPF
jgi:outer membrane protein assembly factor BamA